jgi:hypothetical protein
MCASVLLGPTEVDSVQEDAWRRPEAAGDEHEAGQRRNGSAVLDEGHECLAQRSGELGLAQSQRDAATVDLGAKETGEIGIPAAGVMFSNS